MFSAYMRKSTCTRASVELSDTLHMQYRYNEHVHKEVSCQKKTFFDQEKFGAAPLLHVDIEIMAETEK